MKVLAAVCAIVVACAGCGGASSDEAADERLGPPQLVEALREGGYVVYLRHAATDRSQLDEGLVDLDDCSKQRNLNARGREQSRAIGRGFAELQIPVGETLASEYCRTRETAELAFGSVTLEPRLTGFPNEGDPGRPERVRQTKMLLAREPAPGMNTVLVAHVHNIEAAAGVPLEEGELAVFEPLGGTEFRYRGSIPPEAWRQLVEELAPS